MAMESYDEYVEEYYNLILNIRQKFYDSLVYINFECIRFKLKLLIKLL